MIYDLIIQIFMAASLIAGIIMVVFTIGYRGEIRRVERLVRYVIGVLLVYSVIMRFLLLMPGQFPYMREASIGFDVLYITLSLLGNIMILGRKDGRRKK